MQILGFPLVVQLCLMVGIAGLLWPEKVKPVYEVLMFPWFASYRVVRWHSCAAIGVSILLFLAWIARIHWA
ncbi:MAG TPA: hypothetical protein VFI95_02530 [Terriglobales bacterium]|nr:hypothetical protein [Terriglobales bacterium]